MEHYNYKKYFVFNQERKNTVYHEFQKGKWDGHTFWKYDSICLSDDLLVEFRIDELFADVIKDYNTYSEFEIDEKIWSEIKLRAEQIGGEILECILEADEWVVNTFLEYDVFTLIGV